MKLFKYTCGNDERVGVATDDKDAYNRRAEVDATFHFLPVTIVEIAVEGYEITITPISGKPPDFEALDAVALRAWLEDNGIKYHPQMGEKKLRELCLTTTKESVTE